ncbi:SDR family NAD(P)-dependent oxidoreductase, partial [Mesonia mobilis]
MAKIFITGSSDGLGLLAAKALLSQDHEVCVHARNEQRAKDLKAEL